MFCALNHHLYKGSEYTLDSSPWPSLLALIVLLALSAFFSGSEMAFSSLNQIRIKAMEQDGNKKAKTVLSIIEKFEKTLSTVCTAMCDPKITRQMRFFT